MAGSSRMRPSETTTETTTTTPGATSTPSGSTAASARRGWLDADPPTTSLHQWLNVLSVLGIVVLNVLQRPGTTTFDTKLDLTEDPVGFMGRALSVWNPEITMGSLQNQAYGYLFPVAPFFALGDALGAPMWLWQRLWSALLMVVAYLGMKRLARQVDGIGPGAAVLAGLAYAFAPRVLMTAGVLTGESIPAAVLPWTLLPLLLAWRGRLRWSTAVLLSAASVPFMSGLNATEVICALPLALLLIVMAPLPRRRRVKLATGWSALIGVVCLWWIGPLLILGAYAPPFLNYIESAAVTTDPMTWTTVLRGNDHWLAFLPVADSHWQTGHALSYSPFLVVVSAVVGILGLVGLALFRFPQRRPFLFAAVAALVIMALGHGGWGGSPLAGGFRSFLDGAGAPFRNIHKFDPVVRIGVSVGLAVLVTRLRAPAGRLVRGWPVSVPAAVARRAPTAVVTALVLVLGLPAYQGHLRAEDGWQQVPQAWRQMEQQLQALPSSARVLIVPGNGFADQTWGRTVDELPQTMRHVSWASRTQVPLVGSGGIRLLDSVERVIGAGRPAPDLASLLADAGFTHVLVRDDLVRDVGSSRPSLTRIEASLTGSGGFRPGPSFGQSDSGGQMLQLFAVDAAAGTRARAVPTDQVRTLSGEADQLAGLREAGVLAPSELTRSAGGAAPTRRTDPVLTEGAERRERNFGRVHDAITSVRTPFDPWETRRAAHDYDPVVTTSPTTVDYGMIRSVSASTTADSVTGFGPVRSDTGPWAAFDGVDDTEFRTGALTRPRGQWVQTDLARPADVGRITVALGNPTNAVTAVRVTTDQGSQVRRVPATGRVSVADLGGRTSFVRVTIEAVRDAEVTQVGIAGIDVDGLRPRRTENVAATADARTTLSFRSFSGRSECVGGDHVVCEPLMAVGSEEASGLARRVQVREPGTWVGTGTVRITSGQLANSLLRPPGRGVVVQGSSTYNDQPLAVPMRAMDGDSTTGWTSANGDKDPWLDLSWGQRRRVGEFTLVGAGRAGPGVDPQVASVTVDGRQVPFRLQGSTVRLVRPVQGTSLRINLRSSLGFPVTVSEVTMPAVSDLVYRPQPAYRTSLPCGFGPDLSVDGSTVATRLQGTIADLTSGAPMTVTPCGDPFRVTTGRHRFVMHSASGMVPSTLTFTPTSGTANVQRDVPVRVHSWGAESRRVTVSGTQETLLTVPENINDGWRATIDGRTLQPVTVDGWKQGFVVPAGTRRTVELTYTPAATYRAVLIAGGVGVLLVWLVAAGALVASWPGAGRRSLSSSRLWRGARAGSGPFTRPAPGVHRAARWRSRVRARMRLTVRRARQGRGSALWARLRQPFMVACLVLALGVFAGIGPALGCAAALAVGRSTRTAARPGMLAAAAVLMSLLAAWAWSTDPYSSTMTVWTDVLSGSAFGLLIGVSLTRWAYSRPAGPTSRGDLDA